jgi:iron complex outermembrane recepter protein
MSPHTFDTRRASAAVVANREWRRRWNTAGVAGVLSFGVPALLPAQDGPPATLTPVEVTVTREGSRSPLDLPFAISKTRPDSMRPGQRHLSLDETLMLLPGVTIANRNNPTQDPRISIRGFGARSAFGVRGVRILRDGMPLTLPDGQTPVDYLDLESVGSVEVIRGSASALYGNAAGGVVDIRSSDAPGDALAGQLRSVTGSFGLRRWVGAMGGTSGAFRYQGNVTHSESDGYRAYSHQRLTSGYARVQMKAGATDLALITMLFDMPEAENPGALTQIEMDTMRTQAQAFSVTRLARKAVKQGQIGLTASRRAGAGDVLASVFGGWRNLDNPLTQNIVAVDRVSYGATLRGYLPQRVFGLTHRLSAGLDVQRQDDDRLNFTNCNGNAIPACATASGERGPVTLDQRELVSSIGPFVRDEIELFRRFYLMAGARADYVRFEVTDHLIVPPTNPDDSGDRTLRALSPMAGAVARLGVLTSLYANISSAFETPTATELGNQPDGVGGINRDLDPQYATTYETGLKGVVLSRFQYDIAAFHTRVRDELIPYEVPNGAGRRYFRNAGRTRRRGAEVTVGTRLAGLELNTAYAYSQFKYTDYQLETRVGTVLDTVVYDGNRIPGIPAQTFQASATYRIGRAYATLEGITAASMFVDDANTTRSSGYEVVNARLGGTAVFGKPWFAPVVGVQNVFDRKYVSSVSINAAGGRYYEPAPGRAYFVGLTAAVGR